MKSVKNLTLRQYDETEINKCSIIENRYMCIFLCNNNIYQTEESLKMHYIKIHGYKIANPVHNSITSSTRWYDEKICNICNRNFKNSKTLSKHIKAVHNHLKPYFCVVCDYKSARKSTLYIHSLQHLPESSKPLSCKSCPFRASDPSVLSKHQKLHSQTTEGQIKCISGDCNYFAIQATGMKNHIHLKHPELYSKIKCNQCDFVSINPERLLRHKDNHFKMAFKGNEKDDESQKFESTDHSKMNVNSTTEISSDCFLPIESTDSIVNHSLDTGGVTFIHNNSCSSVNLPAHSEDTQF